MYLALECVTQKYATFSGRARRKEYWLFYLAWFILAVIAVGIDMVIGSPVIEIGVVGIVNVALICPSLAVSVRRLPATNRRGLWLLMYLIPFIGAIWLIVLFCFKGMEGERNEASEGQHLQGLQENERGGAGLPSLSMNSSTSSFSSSSSPLFSTIYQ